MKARRQSKILELILNNNIETQSELIEKLEENGIHVTQATASRDIREMRLVKVLADDGSYKYAPESTQSDDEESHIYLFSNAVTSVDYAHNLVVIKTGAGMAQAVCAALDSTHRPGVLGSIAGDDTIFVAARTDSAAANLAAELKKLISRKNG